jgi:hypothetical protein
MDVVSSKRRQREHEELDQDAEDFDKIHEFKCVISYPHLRTTLYMHTPPLTRN